VRALLSVSDKRGLVPFARELIELGWEIVSTGGTADALRREQIPVIPVEQVTGSPEMMDGRVKTLHPAIHGGLLARRGHPGDDSALAQHGIVPIDLVAVNLYPFRETAATPDAPFEHVLEQIDIGGPSMLRSAAKNHARVVVIVDPDDYPLVITGLKDGSLTPGAHAGNGSPPSMRRRLAAKVFAHTAAYDAAIFSYLTREDQDLPSSIGLVLERRQPLRYGENPHQRAALYGAGEGDGVAALRQLHGKELSFNNLLDVDAATGAISPWLEISDRVACVIVKHTTPCGIALAANATEAYKRALATDETSAFGSVIAFTSEIDREAALAMRELFVEVIIAPRVREAALAVLREKRNLRVVEMPNALTPGAAPALDFKRVRGGFLVQDRFDYRRALDETAWKVVTRREPEPHEWRDLRFAWAAVGSVKSNAVLLARDESAIGIGAGQMSRVDSSFLAVHKARRQGHDPRGAVLASDAFFPFADGVVEAAEAGISAIIQPGGSVRDPEVIQAADERGIAMIFTGLRQFRH
jgi:phosphoribosylaminoimidazolecarboxamide formyltransferase/IMP cyclohydrolase